MVSTYEDRKKMFDTMKILVKSEQEEIYRIIRKSKETYTENSNGIFFDMASISESSYLQIKEYLDFCLKTREDMDNRQKEIDIIRTQSDQFIEKP
jgi:dsDNA-specific endonuclease/ATPase MutS2